MAFKQQDRIDKNLVKKYYNLKMENPDTTKLVDSKKMLDTMNEYAMMQRNMFAMNEKLKSICNDVTSKSVVYMKINYNLPKLRRNK